MFSFYKVILDLLKARTHKYVRRVPIGATHTGATKYKYYYQEQAGHGKGLGHESELVKDASFSFGEGENKYHAHIKSVDGDKLTIEYDDGAKKGQRETLSKTEFQNRIHKEHATSIKNAHEKAKKQLATFEKMKTTGAKVKDSTLDKLKAQVEKFNSLAKTPAQEEHIEQYHRSIEQLGSLAKTIRDLSHGDKDKAGLRFISAPFMGSPEIEDIVNEINESSEDGDYNKYKDELNTLPSDSIGMDAYKYIDKQINNPSEKGMYAVITRKKYDEDTWKNHIKPALQSIGMDKFMGVLNFDKHGSGLQYQIPFYFIQKLGTEKAKQFLKDTFTQDENIESKPKQLTESQHDYIQRYNNSRYQGYDSYIFEDGSVGTEIDDDDMEGRNPDNLYLYVEGDFKDKDKLWRLGFRWDRKKEGSRGLSYYKYKAPVSRQ